jgi:hypothetical protein
MIKLYAEVENGEKDQNFECKSFQKFTKFKNNIEMENEEFFRIDNFSYGYFYRKLDDFL